MYQGGKKNHFASEFLGLYERAGKPTLRKIVRAANIRIMNQDSRSSLVSFQRVSDWKLGRNLPSDFDRLSACLMVLFEIVRSREKMNTFDPKLNLEYWHNLWSEARKDIKHRQIPDNQLSRFNNVSESTTEFSPYMGLNSFTTWDSEYYFGREADCKAVEILVRKLLNTIKTDRAKIMFLVGSSGVGKSSFINAGLVPHLGEYCSINSLNAQDLTECNIDFSHDFFLQESQRKSLVIIDQFEELLVDDKNLLLDNILSKLYGLSCDSSQEVVVLLSIRSDFYHKFFDFPYLKEVLEHNTYILQALDHRSLRSVMINPIRKLGIKFEQGLVDRILNEIQQFNAAHSDNPLPLLSLALRQLWYARNDRKILTLSAYQDMGGVEQSINFLGEQFWISLNEQQKDLTEIILLQLINFRKDTVDTKRIVHKVDLLTVLSNQVSSFNDILEKLILSRLVIVDHSYIYFTHDAILLHWKRLVILRDQFREQYLLQQDLEKDATLWKEDKKHRSYLYSGPRLSRIKELSHASLIDDLVKDFLKSSVKYDLLKNRIKIISVISLVASLIFSIFFAYHYYTNTQQLAKNKNDLIIQNVLLDARSLINTAPNISAQLLAAVYKIAPQNVYTDLINIEQKTLSRTINDSGGEIDGLDYDPGTQRIVSAGSDGIIRQISYNTNSPSIMLLKGHSLFVTSVKYVDGGSHIISASGDGTLRVWNSSDGHQIVEANPHCGPIYQIAVIPHSTNFTIACHDGSLQIWALKFNQLLKVSEYKNSSDPEPIRVVAVSPDSSLIASGGNDRKVTIWKNLGFGKIEKVLQLESVFKYTVHAMDFSPVNNLLAVGSDDGTVRLWHYNKQLRFRLQPIIVQHSSNVWSVDFSPDGKQLATSSWDGTIKLWNLVDLVPQWKETLSDSSGVSSIKFIPGVDRLISGHQSGEINIWDMNKTIVIPESKAYIKSFFSTDGKSLVQLGVNKTISIYDIRSDKEIAQIGDVDFSDSDIAMEGRKIALASSGNKIIHVWDISSGTPVETQISNPALYSYNIIFSHDGQYLLSPHSDSSLALWDMRKFHTPVLMNIVNINTRGWINSIAMSNDNHYVAIGSSNSQIAIWDISHPKNPQKISELTVFHDKELITSISISNDARYIALGSTRGKIALMERKGDRYVLQSVVTVPGNNAVQSLAFNSNDSILASGSTHFGVAIWEIVNDHLILKGDPIGNSEASDWSLNFSQTTHHLETANDLGEVYLWNLGVAQELARICNNTSQIRKSYWDSLFPNIEYIETCRR